MNTGFESWQQRRMAKFTPEQREEIAQLTESVRQNQWRLFAALIFFWLVGVVAMRYFIGEPSWQTAIMVPLIIVGAVGFGLLSVWMQPTRVNCKSNGWLKLAVLATGFAVLGAFAGAFVGRLAKGGMQALEQDDLLQLGSRVLIGGLVAGVIYAAMTVAVLQLRRNLLARRNEQLQKLATDERFARQLTDAKLRLLQAQVEPHFLFNTLASVQHLAEENSPAAARLTAQLITFLRGGLSGLREEFTTLEREFAMAASYLDIMKTRMGPRLNFKLDLPTDLASQSIPPAMLISLVENAIKHGLEPAPDGGRIDLVAVRSRSGNQLIIQVNDTGRGRGASALNNGLGLTNIHERLRAIYGERASLDLGENLPTGFIATLTFPISLPDTEDV